jgi:hypothetical protein
MHDVVSRAATLSPIRSRFSRSRDDTAKTQLQLSRSSWVTLDFAFLTAALRLPPILDKYHCASRQSPLPELVNKKDHCAQFAMN